MAATAEDWSFDDNEELLDQRYDDGIEGTYEEEADNYLNLRKPGNEWKVGVGCIVRTNALNPPPPL